MSASTENELSRDNDVVRLFDSCTTIGTLRLPMQTLSSRRISMSGKGPEVVSKPEETKVSMTSTLVRGVGIYHFPSVSDPRGDLTVGEFDREFPFQPKRYFIISGVPSSEIRGEHAHRQCHQFLICAYGQCSVTVDDGSTRLEFQLNRPSIGIYIPPMIWGRQSQYSADAALLVFASELYDPADYIRDYDTFRGLLAR